MRILLVLFLSIALIACSNNQQAVNNETINIENNDTEEKLTLELIQLFKEKKYDEIISKTLKQNTELEKEFFNIAFAFKNIEIKTSTWFERDYEYALGKLNLIKNPPNEITEEINKTKMKIERNYVEYLMEKLYFPIGESQPVHIGMTQVEVLKKGWGKPIDINRTTTANGVDEQWVYKNNHYLYFEDGILVTIQN